MPLSEVWRLAGASHLYRGPTGQELFHQHRQSLKLLTLNPETGTSLVALDQHPKRPLTRPAYRVSLQPCDRTKITPLGQLSPAFR